MTGMALAFRVFNPGVPITGLEDWLREKGVQVEGRVRWPAGGVSLYLSDPDGHLAELATPRLWSIY